MTKKNTDKRSEPRTIPERYHSVEISPQGLNSVYQFKVWDISQKGMCILVKEDSAVISHIHVDDVVRMKYYQEDDLQSSVVLKTKIRHITKDEEGRFKGHYLVGLSILEARLDTE
jgi:hypothetical protein